jgi:hypothetical protein
MKIDQQTLVRWMSKLVAKGNRSSVRKQASSSFQEIDIATLRRVGGGDGNSTQSPNKGW